MTEKSYGGNNGVREHTGGKTIKTKQSSKLINKEQKSKTEIVTSSDNKINNESIDEFESYKKAGEIAVKVREYAKKLIKPGISLLEVAKKIEEEIIKLGGEVGFPVNLAINEIAAHYHPSLEDETKASGLLKVDIGIHVNGFIADSAFSLDLTEDKKHTSLIKASEEALELALKILDKNPSLNEIGNEIQKAIQKRGFSPIINLSGHSLGKYNIHSGITIPNCANNNPHKLGAGAYAIEPFATTGEGKVYDGPSSNIFKIINLKNTRSPIARQILEYAYEKYKTLPFSLREMQEKFGNMARLGIRELEQNGVIHNYPQLIEKFHKPVSQAEHTFVKTKNGKIIVITR